MTIRVGVVGAGLVAQAEHLPYLSSLRDRFTIAAIAEPSLTVREALRAEGVLAMRIYDPGFVDLHAYPYWKPVLDAIAAEGRPAPDCPRTLDLLGRSIHIDLSPLNDEQDLDEIAFAFEKVAAGVLERA